MLEYAFGDSTRFSRDDFKGRAEISKVRAFINILTPLQAYSLCLDRTKDQNERECLSIREKSFDLRWRRATSAHFSRPQWRRHRGCKEYDVTRYKNTIRKKDFSRGGLYVLLALARVFRRSTARFIRDSARPGRVRAIALARRQ
jgi:hypothetical protein